MSEIAAASPGDIYVDESGKLWRIVGVCHEPTVTAEAVEGYVDDPNAQNFNVAAAGVAAQAFVPRTAKIVKPRQTGGMNGLMWQGWKRIWSAKP